MSRRDLHVQWLAPSTGAQLNWSSCRERPADGAVRRLIQPEAAAKMEVFFLWPLQPPPFCPLAPTTSLVYSLQGIQQAEAAELVEATNSLAPNGGQV